MYKYELNHTKKYLLQYLIINVDRSTWWSSFEVNSLALCKCYLSPILLYYKEYLTVKIRGIQQYILRTLANTTVFSQRFS